MRIKLHCCVKIKKQILTKRERERETSVEGYFVLFWHFWKGYFSVVFTWIRVSPRPLHPPQPACFTPPFPTQPCLVSLLSFSLSLCTNASLPFRTSSFPLHPTSLFFSPTASLLSLLHTDSFFPPPSMDTVPSFPPSPLYCSPSNSLRLVLFLYWRLFAPVTKYSCQFTPATTACPLRPLKHVTPHTCPRNQHMSPHICPKNTTAQVSPHKSPPTCVTSCWSTLVTTHLFNSPTRVNSAVTQTHT